MDSITWLKHEVAKNPEAPEGLELFDWRVAEGEGEQYLTLDIPLADGQANYQKKIAIAPTLDVRRGDLLLYQVGWHWYEGIAVYWIVRDDLKVQS